jgi:hypothetical protein
MMNNKFSVRPILSLLAGAAMLLIFNSCNDDALEKPFANSRISTNSDISSLNNRVRIPQYDEALSVNDVKLSLPNARQDNQVSNHSTYELLLRAEVAPPEIGGEKLQASHVFIEGELAFVSYNTEGPVYRGGIEVFNISNIKSPSLIYQLVVEGTDYSSIYYEDGKIYLAGATESTESFGLGSPAILEIMDYPVITGSESTVIDISSFTATDVKVHGQHIYVSSGSHGGLTIFDKTSLEKVLATGMDDARSIAFNDEFYAVMQGTPARVKIYRIDDNSYVNSYTVGGAEIPESKSILSMDNEKLFVPTGKDGLKMISINSGELLEHMGLPQMEEVEDDLVVTNGVSVNGKYVFCANGAAGLFLSEQLPEQTSLMGSVNFQASTNYVESREQVMFVATGMGGLKIIEIVEHTPEEEDYEEIGDWDEDGTPQYLCEDNAAIASILRDRMSLIFQSKENLMERKPEYFSGNPTTDLFLTKDTDVEVIFYSETAGYKNILGYYVYDSENPPATVEELSEMTIIFPNTSARGSGGWLRQGNKVCLTNLKAGSVVGFFMLVDGWKGKITNGMTTNFTTKNLNTELPQEYRQTSLLLGVEDEDAMILTFEDRKLPGGDKDFDDAVFILQTSTPNSVDYSKLTPLD